MSLETMHNTVLTNTIDIVHSPDDNGYYLQEYKFDGKGTTRTSPIYTSRVLLMLDYRQGKIKWGKWE